MFTYYVYLTHLEVGLTQTAKYVLNRQVRKVVNKNGLKNDKSFEIYLI